MNKINKSFIYIITDGEHYKVGISKDPEKRLLQLQTGSPRAIKIVETFCLSDDTIFKAEKECHARIQSFYVKRGEWFIGATQFHIQVLVSEICDQYIIE